MQTRSLRALIDTPPVWLVAAIALAYAQARWLPVWPAPPTSAALGLMVMAGGLALFVAAGAQFRRHRTTIVPRERPTRLLTTGPYAVSRNPIYLADALMLLGLVMRWDLGSLAVVAGFVALLQVRFIRGEEAGCAAAFGAEWTAYAARVRRWL
jgi:protein-S-isoprenylcysteine O-methyltransferase Ste14